MLTPKVIEVLNGMCKKQIDILQSNKNIVGVLPTQGKNSIQSLS